MIDFKRLFPKQEPKVTIRIKREMMIDGQPVPAGTTISVPLTTARGLDGVDCEFISDTAAPKISDPTAPRPDVQPAPAAWQNLPKCFTEWHDTMERFRVALEHICILREDRINIFGTDALLVGNGGHGAGGDGGGKVLVNNAKTGLRIGGSIYIHSQIHDLDSPVFQKLANFHESARLAADEHLAELRKTFNLKLQSLHLECGQHRLAGVEEIEKLILEIRAIGIELFGMRVAALELAPRKIHDLYSGSALFLKYGIIQPPIIPGICSGGFDFEGAQRIYVEDGPISIASGVFRDIEQIAELNPLLAEGKRELAAARKAALPVAA